MPEYLQENIVKNYESCPFRLTLPFFEIVDNSLNIRFAIRKKEGVSLVVAVDKVIFNDSLKRRFACYPEAELCPDKWYKKTAHISMHVQDRFAILRNSILDITLLCDDNHRYAITYILGSGGKASKLDQIRISGLSNGDTLRLKEIISAAEKSDSTDETQTGMEDKMADVEVFPGLSTPELDDYKEALRRELYFLKSNGGRKYKVSNGSRLIGSNGVFTYSFELESELYIADDSPVVLTISGGVVSGSVLLCESYQIVLQLNRDIGLRVGSAMLSVEPWKLLDAQLSMLDSLSSEHILAKKLLEEGPKLATKAGIGEIYKGQKTAVEHAQKEAITVLWGPPGTGKTYTMARIAINAMKKGESVLIVSHSNVSVDGVILSIADQLRESHQEKFIERGDVLRYGYVRDDRLNSEEKLTTFNFALSNHKDIKQQIDALQRKKNERKQKKSAYSVEDLATEKRLKELRAYLKEEEKEYAEDATILATTISKVTIDKLFVKKKYDVVMFDEVSMAYVTQIICAAMYAKKRFVCVGDFRQLAPIVQGKKADILKKDIFEYLGISSIDHKVHFHPWLVMLNSQRRMYPDIAAFASAEVYYGQLKNHVGIKEQRQSIVDAKPLSSYAMNLIDLSGTYCAAAKDTNNSRYNVLSAVITFATARTVEINGEDKIGIITPYAAQTRIIRAMVKDLQEKTDSNIACSTVHQFQGSERNVIVFDAVEGYPFSKAGWLMSKNENNSVTRLINVALTRARGKFITVADVRFWRKKFEGTANIYYSLLRYIITRGNTIGIQEKKMQHYLQSLEYGNNIQYFDDFRTAEGKFDRDIKKAKDKIVISIPDGALNKDSQQVIYELLMSAKKRGIHIYCKSNNYADLPDNWKSLSWGTENAIIPVIKIDDFAIWYGLPLSRGQFKDGNTWYATVLPMILRITGKHTVDIISSITDLENTEVNNTKSALKERTKDDVLSKGKTSISNQNDGKAVGGVAGFVLREEHCGKCKKPLKLVKNKKGVFYMRCTDPNCDYTEYLHVEDIDDYIAEEHVTCPIHHCGIYGGLGKYGVYVRCNMGHYLKVDEI